MNTIQIESHMEQMDAARTEFNQLFGTVLWPKLKSMWSEKSKHAVIQIAWMAWKEGRGIK